MRGALPTYGATSDGVSAFRETSLGWATRVIVAVGCVAFATLGGVGFASRASRVRAFGLDSCARFGAAHALDEGVQLPVIVLGFPKTGTTSLQAYFRCGGLDTSHYKCGDHGMCGECIKDALDAGDPPLRSCGDYQAWAQLDFAGNPDDGLAGLDSRDDVCYFPQVEALDAMHAEHPSATFVLNRRSTTDAWLESVDEWNDLRQRLADCDITGLPEGTGASGEKGDARLRAFVESHERRVREFVAAHPSHRLVEVVIDDPGAGDVLETAFGISARCWGRENVNPKDKGVAALSRFRGCDFRRDASGGEASGGSPVISFAP